MSQTEATADADDPIIGPPNVQRRGLHIAITLPSYPELQHEWSDGDICTFFRLMTGLVLKGQASMTLTPFNHPPDSHPLRAAEAVGDGAMGRNSESQSNLSSGESCGPSALRPIPLVLSPTLTVVR